MKKLISICAAAVLACLASSGASATTYTATWTGTVLSATDGFDTFQTGGGIAGQAFKMVFTFDSDNMTRTTGPSADTLDGPGGSTTLTINNISYTVASGASTNASDHVSHSGAVSQSMAATTTTGAALFTASDGLANGSPSSLDTAFSGACSIFCQVAATFIDLPSAGPFVVFQGTFNATNYTLAATPIPAALPLFVSALGGIGFLGWRQRKAQPAA